MDPARAKSYLMELSRQRQTIRRLNEQLTEIQARMGASSPRLQEEHVRKSRVYDSLERAAVQAADLKQEIQERTLTYWILREEVIERIHKLTDYQQTDILYRVYVQEQSAAEAAAQMGITYRHAMRIHAAALEAFAELLPLQEQEK